jgi:hypothetical protein
MIDPKSSMKNHISTIISMAGLSAVIQISPPVFAQITSPAPFLPPAGSYYVNPPTQPVSFTNPLLAAYGIQSILLSDLVHTPGIVTNSGATPSGDFFDQFNSTLTGNALINLTAGGSISGLLNGTGPTLVVVGNGYTNGAVGGPWNTDMTLNWPVQITWSGRPIDFFLACSNAPGSTSVTPLLEGDYRIDSFFDVWPELSLDDGLHWVPADDSVMMSIVPEPPASALAAFVILLLWLQTGIRRLG